MTTRSVSLRKEMRTRVSGPRPSSPTSRSDLSRRQRIGREGNASRTAAEVSVRDGIAGGGRPWQRVNRRIAYENAWIEVYHDEVVMPDGEPGVYGVIHPKF